MLKKYRRSTIRRRMLRRKRRSLPRAIPNRRQEVVNVVRTFNYSYWQPSTTTTADFWKLYAFRYQDLPTYSEFNALFDMVRINRIKVVFRPRFDSFSGENTTDTTLPGITNQAGVNLHIVKDPYSETIPGGTYTRTTLNQFLEAGKVKTYSGTRAISVYYKPTTYMSLDGSAIGKRIPAPWQQTSANPQYYGFHAFAQDFNLNGTFGQSWDVFVTYYMQFKGIR